MNMKPPVLATWMRQHLGLGDGNEALQGDLLEEFQHRQSESWYWRQVWAAVLSFSNLMRAAWVAGSAVAFAAGWGYGLCLLAAFRAHTPLHMASGYWILWGNPIWMGVGLALYLAAPLSLYLALARKLSARAFTVGLCAGTGVFMVMAVPFVLAFFQTHLNTPINGVFAYVLAHRWNVIPWLRGFEALQGSLPLLAAMAAARLGWMKLSPPSAPAGHEPSSTGSSALMGTNAGNLPRPCGPLPRRGTH